MAEILKNVRLGEDIQYLGSVPYDEEPNLPLTEQETPGEESLRERYQNAYTEGFDAGQAQARLDMAAQCQTLDTLLETIPDAICNNRHQLSGEIADIVLTMMQAFFVNQQQNKDSIAQRVTQTITLLNNKHNLELFLHPDDLALLKQGELNIDLSACQGLRVIADEKLRLGGCVIKSEHGLFDAGIERQIDNLKQVLLQLKNGEKRD